MLLRPWEIAERPGPVSIEVKGFTRATQTDLLERNLKPIFDSAKPKNPSGARRRAFSAVLHRLLAPACGPSDRAAEKWQTGYQGPQPAPLELQHLYRAMAWLGEERPVRRPAR